MPNTENSAGRKILVPRSPRRCSRSPTPKDRKSISAETAHRISSLSSSATSASNSTKELPAEMKDDQKIIRTLSQDGESQMSPREGVEDLHIPGGTYDDLANSESKTISPLSEAGRDKSGGADSIDKPPLTPSISLDSADIPLPSVEAEDSLTPGKNSIQALTATDGASSEFKSSVSAECTSLDRTISDHQRIPNERRANNPLSPSTPQRSSVSQSSEGLLTPTSTDSNPVTVRGLANATPTPSPAQSSGIGMEVEDGLIQARFDPPGLVPISSMKPSGEIREEEKLGQAGLIVAAETSEGEDLDFLDELAGLQIADQYDARSTEPLPASPFSNSGFQESLKRGISVANAIVRSIDGCELATISDTQLHSLRESASRLSQFDYPAKRRIGIVGDSGAGKSSLINSLLNISDLALRGDHGCAVTSFVTEYRSRKAGQTAPFTIKVKCADRLHLRDQIDELIFDVRASTEPSILEALSDKDFQALERRSAVALSTLESIFPAKEESTKEFLLERTEGSANRIKTRLRELTDNISFPQGAESGEWVETANTASECRQHIVQLMENDFWPLINKVKVYLSAQVLKTGVILADLPGFRDINLARVKKAEAYQHKCDEIFIVANIKRVVSDRSVRDLMTGEFSNPKPNTTVSIICTHADEINLIDWTSNQNRRRLVDQNKLRTVTREMRSAVSNNQADLLEKAQTELKYLFVALRNDTVRKDVFAKYASLVTGNARLRVFCIGNKDYEHRELRFPESQMLAIRGSGVPELRDFCHSVVAKAQFRAGNHFLETQIPDLVQSLKLWIEAADNEPGPVLPSNALSDLREKLLSSVELFSDKLEQDLELQILGPFKQSQRSYDRSAIEAGQNWICWHHASFKAYVVNNGTHSTNAVPSRCMNKELIDEMIRDLADAWKMLEEMLEQAASKLQGSLEAQIAAMRHSLRDSKAPDSLVNAIKLKERDIRYRLQGQQESFLDAFRTIQHNATSNHYNSYILATMLPTYRSCAMESGPGMKARMFDTMTRKLARRDIFTFIRHQITNESSKLFENTTDAIKALVNDICTDIQRQVQLVRGPESEASRIGPVNLQRIAQANHTAEDELRDLKIQASPAQREAVRLAWID